MKVNEIYFKTMKFTWAKLALGLITVALSAVLLALVVGLIALTQNTAVALFGIIIWLGGTSVIDFMMNQYFGYLIKAGHIAVIQRAVTTGQIPENQIEYGKQMVINRFGTSNVYFVIDKLVSGSVKQLQNGLQRVDNLLGSIPGVSMIISFAKVFVGVSLGYVDECCLGYTFYNNEQSAFKSAADGVVIYFQNWKHILKNAAVTSIIVIIATVAAWILPFLLFSVIFAALGWNQWIAFLLSIMFAISIKSAFIDSYMMVKMMVSYMQVAPSTQITFNLYDKLCRLSRKFKELFGKAQESMPSFQHSVASEPQPIPVAASASQYCPHCGSPINGAFCPSCGARVS